jgi:putative ribosome biogenesis GTPase RsgA
LLNALDPDGTRSIGTVRDHDGKGRHTTAWSSLR